MSTYWPWLTLAGLGAYHGLNPAMGWLLAVALGLQEGRRAAIWRALPAIALGHEASVAVATALISGLQLVATPDALRAAGALALLAFGAVKLLRPRWHPRWVGMRLGTRDLVVWSFLMSSAHGAGLMLFPVLLGFPSGPHAHDDLAALGLDATSIGWAAAAVLVHTLAMLLVMGIMAGLVYEKLGVRVLRRAWLNLDLLWATAIMTAGVLTLFT